MGENCQEGEETFQFTFVGVRWPAIENFFDPLEGDTRHNNHRMDHLTDLHIHKVDSLAGLEQYIRDHDDINVHIIHLLRGVWTD